MEFPLGGLSIHLKGLGGEQSTVGSANKFLKELKRDTKGLVIQLIEEGIGKETVTTDWQV